MSGNESPSISCVKREPEEVDTYGHSFYTKTVPGLGLESLAPAAPAAVPVTTGPAAEPRVAATLATLQAAPVSQTCSLLERHRSLTSQNHQDDEYALYRIKVEPSDEPQEPEPGSCSDDASPASPLAGSRSPKAWTAQDMENALQALRSHSMSLTKASATYGIPSTTLWQRAHRLGIDTPKKEGNTKSWSHADLRRALHALRSGAISANKASKAYGIPSSTLYKIARREGIRLAAPFNAAPTTWQPSELHQALEAIRCGAASVQRAAAQYGIPTGTLYGRCKREGIELSRSNPTPWSESAMGEALEAVRVGQMSINQAAIHYNLPYSSLYGRFKRIKQVNHPHDYVESQTSDPAGANLPTSHTTHPEIAFLNQSVQNVHPPSPHRTEVHPGLQIDQDLRSPTHLMSQGLKTNLQGAHSIEQGSNTTNSQLISQGLNLTTAQGLKRIDQGLNSPNNVNKSLTLLNSVTQLHSQSEIHDEGLAATQQMERRFHLPVDHVDHLQQSIIRQDNQSLHVPISERINQGLSSTSHYVSQDLNSPTPTVTHDLQSLQGLNEIDRGLNPPNQGLQSLNPFVFTQYSDQCPSEFSLYYQSCNGLAS